MVVLDTWTALGYHYVIRRGNALGAAKLTPPYFRGALHVNFYAQKYPLPVLQWLYKHD